MNVVSIGNMAADGLLTTQALREVGVNAELLVNEYDFACAFPEWEMGGFGRNLSVTTETDIINPYTAREQSLKTQWTRPYWIKTLKLSRGLKIKDIRVGLGLSHSWLGMRVRRLARGVMILATVKGVLDAVRPYDIVEAHVPYSLNMQFSRKPYIIYEAGWVRSVVSGKYRGVEKTLLKRSYEKAAKVVYTNPDMYHIFKQHRIAEGKTVFVPFAIDLDRYKPVNVGDVREFLAPHNEFLVLGMARQNWSVKGSHILIRGFAAFHKTCPRSRLVLMEWGDDLEYSNQLIIMLGIQECVTWLPFLPKSKLILLYNAVDVAVDQFLIGCWGTAFPEAMACGRPTLIYYNCSDILRAFGDLPPVASVRNESELVAQLSRYYSNHRGVYHYCRRWIERTHGLKLVGEKHRKICEEVLR